MNAKLALEEYEKLIQQTAIFEASIIEIQEMIRRDADTMAYRKFVVSKAVDAAKRLDVSLTVFLIASELIMNGRE